MSSSNADFNPGHACQDVRRCLAECFKDCGVVVELGAGKCDWIRTVPARVKCAIEIHRPSLSGIQPVPDILCVNYDMRRIPEIFVCNSVDGFLMVDALEHITKAEGRQLLREMESIARKEIVLWVPEGEHPQGAIDGNEWQRHRATWQHAELEALGYDVAVWENYHKKPYGLRNAMFCVKRLEDDARR